MRGGANAEIPPSDEVNKNQRGRLCKSEEDAQVPQTSENHAKVVPKATTDGIEGAVLRPVVVAV